MERLALPSHRKNTAHSGDGFAVFQDALQSREQGQFIDELFDVAPDLLQTSVQKLVSEEMAKTSPSDEIRLGILLQVRDNLNLDPFYALAGGIAIIIYAFVFAYVIVLAENN